MEGIMNSFFPQPEHRQEPLFVDQQREITFRKTYNTLRTELEDGSPEERIIPIRTDLTSTAEIFGEVLARLHCDQSVVLTHSSWSESTSKSLESLIEKSSLETKRAPTLTKACIYFRTGGSSGTPKFAAHNTQTLAAAASNLSGTFEGKTISSVLSLPIYHVSGFMPLVRAWATNGMVAHRGDHLPSGKTILRTTSVVPTTLYRSMRKTEEHDCFKEMDLVFAGGASFTDVLLKEALDSGVPLAPSYGMTETAGMVAVQHPHDFASTKELNLTPLHNNKLSLDPQGEILIQTQQLFSGYLGERVIARESKPRPWASGDIGKMTDGGGWQVLGRIGDFIHSGGETVSLLKVENIVRNIKGVVDAVAQGYDDPEWGQKIILFVEVNSEMKPDHLRQRLTTFLDRHEMPEKIRFLTKIPRTEAGKLDRDKLD